MLANRAWLVVSAVATIAFAAALAVGLSSDPKPESGPLMSVISAMAHETVALDCDIREP